MGRRTLNQLPLRKPHCWRPGPKALTTARRPNTAYDTEDLLDLAVDGLLYGLGAAQGVELLPLNQDDPTYLPRPGRGLWNLLDILRLEEVEQNPDPDLLAPFLSLALRPSPRGFPEITPRMALHLAGLRIAEATALQRKLSDLGIVPTRPSNHDAYLFFYSQGYGPELDRKLDTLRLHLMPGPQYTKPPRNSKRTQVQEYLLFKERDYPPHMLGKLTLPELAMAHPPFEVDVGPRLHELYDRATVRLRRQAERARKGSLPDHLRPYLDDIDQVDLHLLEHQVVEHFLTGDWRLYDLYNDSLSLSDYLITAMTRCMVQEYYTGSLWRYQQPALLLTVAIASGVSPAVMVKAAIHQLKRTGLSFLADSHPTAIADMIRTIPEGPAAANQRRLDLIDELDDLQHEFTHATDNLPTGMAEEARLATFGNNFPAWGLGDGFEGDD